MGELFLIAIAVVGATLLATTDEAKRIAKKLRAARPVDIADLPDGKAAAARGVVEPIDPQAEFPISPLTQRRCVYWLVVFDEVGVRGDYEELGRADGGVPFLLRANAATARVVPEHVARPAVPPTAVEVPFAYDLFQRGAASNDPRRARIAQLASMARCRMPHHHTTGLRATEYVIEPAQTILVCGWVTRESEPTASERVTGYRTELPTRPVFSGTKRTKLMIGA